MAGDRLAAAIKSRMAGKGLNAKSLSARAGLGDTGVSDIFRARSKNMRIDTLEKIAGALDLSAADLLNEADGATNIGNTAEQPALLAAHYVRIEGLNAYFAGAGAVLGVQLDEGEATAPLWLPEQTVLELRVAPEHLLHTSIEGNSMEPMLRAKDQILVNTRDKNVSDEGVFLVHIGYGVTVKLVELVYPRTDPPRIRLIPLNKELKPSEHTIGDGGEARIIGRVVWFARRM